MKFSLSYLQNLPEFLVWFCMAAAMAGALMLIYTRVTPWHEFQLIRAGNTAAALSFTGTLTGYALVLCSIMRNAVSRGDMLSWGLVGFAVQLLALAVARLIVGPAMRERMERGEAGAGIVLAGVSLAFGLLNAAAMTPDATYTAPPAGVP